MGDKLKARTFVLAVARRQSCEQAIFHAHLSSQRKTSLPGESAGRGHVPTTPTVLLSSHGEWGHVGTSSPQEVTSNPQWNPGRVTAEIGDKRQGCQGQGPGILKRTRGMLGNLEQNPSL